MNIFSKSKKSAVMLSYFSIILQTISTIILTRLYLEQLGVDMYGLYQMIYSVAQYILILDLGISTVMIRYLSEFIAIKDSQKIENFAFHFTLIVGVIIGAIIIIGIFINTNIEYIYGNLTIQEYEISHKLFGIMIVQLVFTVIARYFQGICDANERFSVTRATMILQILINFLLSFCFLKCGMGVIGIALANTIVIIINVIVISIYDFAILKYRIRYHELDLSLLKPVAALMFAMLLQSIIGHINASADKTILGILADKSDVSIYAIAATIITMFNTLPTIISNVYQPQATRLVINNTDKESMTDFVIKPGRLQFILIGGFLCCFIGLGKDFIACWVGASMLPAWYYVLIIAIPNSIPLMQNVCLSILNAMDKRLHRSLILLGTTFLNIVLTVLLIHIIGPIGAPIGTGIAYIIGHCIIMNIYYRFIIGLNIKRMFCEITEGTLVSVVIVTIVAIPFVLFQNSYTWLTMALKAVFFTLLYIFLIVKYSLKSDERTLLKNIVKVTFGKKYL